MVQMAVKKQLERGLFLLAALVIVLWGFWEGLRITEVTLNLLYIVIEVTVLDAVSSSLFFTGFVTVFGGILLYQSYSTPDAPRITDDGTVASIVPVYKDADVLANSVDSLHSATYEDVDVYVVCEKDDTASQEAAEGLDCTMLLNDHPGSKAGAINTAFEQVDADYYAVFDADETVSPEFLSTGIGYINEGYEAFKARRISIPTGPVEAFGYCERALFNVANMFMAATRFKNVTSSSIIMTRDVWERTGGYDDMLTEDIDFRHKAFRAAVSAKQHTGCTNLMEAPHTWRDFWNQRKRWATGMAEVVHKAVTGGYDNNWSLRGITSTVRAVISLVAMISLLFLIPKFAILLLLDLNTIFLLPFLSIVTVVTLLSWRDHRAHDIPFLGWHALLAVPVILIVGLIALKAAFEYLLTWEGEWYHVEKQAD